MSSSAGRPHRGRRDNGLDAPEFVALADVDPRIGEHLLDVLGVVGIAAYLAPSADLNPVVRATTLPSRPTDRLWVDRERLDEARGLYEAVQEDEAASAAPARPTTPVRGLEVDVDAEWERIIAGYDATAAPERPRRRALAEPVEPAERSEAERSEAETGEAADPLPVRRPGTPEPTDPLDEARRAEDSGPAAPADDASTVTSDPDSERPGLTLPGVEQPGVGQPGEGQPGLEQPGRGVPHSDPNSDGQYPGGATPGSPDNGGPSDGAGGSATNGPTASRGGTPGPGGLFGPVTSVNRLGPIGRDRLTGTDAPPSDFDPDELGAGDDSDEGYDPPPPPPLPRPSLPVVLALLAICVGLILLFRADTLGLSEQARLLLALCGILGGAGALVWRLKDSWDDDDPDDGAVV